VRPTTAIVEAIPPAEGPAPRATRIVLGSRARVSYHEFGALRLRVALQRAAGSSGRANAPRALERALGSLQTLSKGLAGWVHSSDADWFIQLDGDRVILTPADDWVRVPVRSGVASAEPAKRFDVGAVGDADLPDRLADRLSRIARAANLARLSSYVDPDAGLRIDVLRHETDAAAKSLLAGSGEPSVKAGERLQFIVKNTGTVPLDLTMLYVDANFGIFPLFPRTDAELDNRLDPGRERVLEPAEINDDPFGWESVVAIGVESTPRHENFRLLTQESLAEVRGGSDWPPSAIRTLLESAVFGTRGAPTRSVPDRGRFAIAQTWFRVERSQKPR